MTYGIASPDNLISYELTDVPIVMAEQRFQYWQFIFASKMSLLTFLKPNLPNCYTLPYMLNLPLLISDIRALWRSA